LIIFPWCKAWADSVWDDREKVVSYAATQARTIWCLPHAAAGVDRGGVVGGLLLLYVFSIWIFSNRGG